MKELLERAAAGSEADLEAAARAVLSLERDADGVFESGGIAENRYRAGRLLYPVYAQYETKFGKKAGYPEIVSQLAVLESRLEKAYHTAEAADCLALFTDTLAAMSPEIYEHYRSLNDMLRRLARFFVEKEELHMTQFPTEMLKTDITNKDKEALKTAGRALGAACEKGFLPQERYKALSKSLLAYETEE